MPCVPILQKIVLTAAFTVASTLSGVNTFSTRAEASEDRCIRKFSTLQELNEFMRSENQKLVIVANEPVPSTKIVNGVFPIHDEARLFYMNKTSREGYLVTAKEAFSPSITKTCVEEKLGNTILFDARISGVDPAAKIKGNRDIALKQCDAIGKKRCGFHNEILAKSDANGYRVYFQAIALNKQINGSFEQGSLLTVYGSTTGKRDGALSYTTPQGANTLANPYTFVTYTPSSIEILEERSINSRDDMSK